MFLVLAPGVAGGLIPWLLTRWAAGEWWPPVRVLGAVMIAVGLAVLLEAFVRFVVEGIGTLRRWRHPSGWSSAALIAMCAIPCIWPLAP